MYGSRFTMNIYLFLLHLLFFINFVIEGFCENGLGDNKISTEKTVNDLSAEKLSSPDIISPAAELHSSFSDELKTGSSLDVQSSVLDQINVPAELSETVEEIVLTLAGSSFDPGVETNATEERYVVRAQPRENSETAPLAPSLLPEILQADNDTGEVMPSVRIAPEDIPSFSEWSQQQLAERKLADFNVTERVLSSKVRSKNYASPDCGAKILAANPEAVSAASVLTASRDEYMLNHCTARIWFIVELCEAVQAKKVDLANFELFSSSPRELAVFLSSRFPSRDWRAVGRFTAQDSRDIQTFTLSPYLFGKFLKIEVLSHYGKEHYCPLSWVRVYGTSEYEVLATEDDRHSDDDDDLAEEDAGDAPRNLFSSATDAVLSIVKKAAAPFMKTEVRNEAIRTTPSTCVSPRYITVCNNCSQHIYDNLFYLLSCQHTTLYHLIAVPYVRRALVETDICKKYGFDFIPLRKGAPFPLIHKPQKEHYFSVMLKEPYLAALCNVLAVLENRVVVNISLTVKSSNHTEDPPSPPIAISLLPSSSTCDIPHYSTTIPDMSLRDFTDQIKPTKTLREEEVKKWSNLNPIKTGSKQPITDAIPTSLSPSATPSISSRIVKNSSLPVESVPVKVSHPEKAEDTAEGRETKEPDASLDAILHDLTELERVVREQPASATPPPGPPKDSIFLRLANRIKNLELNMSLSSSYLEELSRRYRSQLEVLGQTVNATAIRLEELVKLEELRTRRREEETAVLRAQLAATQRDLSVLISEYNSWLPRPMHLLWFFVELIALWFFFIRWRRPATNEPNISRVPRTQHERGPRRRNSVESVPGYVPPSRPLERRPSDEALEITLATNYFSTERKRKKRRKDSSRKTSAIAMKHIKFEEFHDEVEVLSSAMFRQTSEPLPCTQLDEAILNTEVATSNRFAAFTSPGPPRPPMISRRFSSPAFMRTAMSSRAARVPESSSNLESSQRLKKDSGLRKYMRRLF